MYSRKISASNTASCAVLPAEISCFLVEEPHSCGNHENPKYVLIFAYSILITRTEVLGKLRGMESHTTTCQALRALEPRWKGDDDYAKKTIGTQVPPVIRGV